MIYLIASRSPIAYFLQVQLYLAKWCQFWCQFGLENGKLTCVLVQRQKRNEPAEPPDCCCSCEFLQNGALSISWFFSDLKTVVP